MADPTIPPHKTCSKCGETKPLEDFARDKYKKSGRMSQCKVCSYAKHQEWMERNPDYQNEWRKRNPEKAKAIVRRYRQRHPEKCREWEAKRAPRDPEKKRAYSQAYYQERKEHFRKENARRYRENKHRNREYAKEWRAKNPDKREAWRLANLDRARAYDAKRRSTPKGRLDDSMSSGISNSLKNGSKAGRKWETLVGYTIDELVAHLERLFEPGMSWDNYGRHGWHVDHKVPLAAFNYETPDHMDFKRAWALENLQPLWAKLNISKSCKLETPFQPNLAI